MIDLIILLGTITTIGIMTFFTASVMYFYADDEASLAKVKAEKVEYIDIT
jgi:hypothetical protein